MEKDTNKCECVCHNLHEGIEIENHCEDCINSHSQELDNVVSGEDVDVFLRKMKEKENKCDICGLTKEQHNYYAINSHSQDEVMLDVRATGEEQLNAVKKEITSPVSFISARVIMYNLEDIHNRNVRKNDDKSLQEEIDAENKLFVEKSVYEKDITKWEKDFKELHFVTLDKLKQKDDEIRKLQDRINVLVDNCNTHEANKNAYKEEIKKLREKVKL